MFRGLNTARLFYSCTVNILRMGQIKIIFDPKSHLLNLEFVMVLTAATRAQILKTKTQLNQVLCNKVKLWLELILMISIVLWDSRFKF